MLRFQHWIGDEDAGDTKGEVLERCSHSFRHLGTLKLSRQIPRTRTYIKQKSWYLRYSPVSRIYSESADFLERLTVLEVTGLKHLSIEIRY